MLDECQQRPSNIPNVRVTLQEIPKHKQSLTILCHTGGNYIQGNLAVILAQCAVFFLPAQQIWSQDGVFEIQRDKGRELVT
jgi:hypothetical protein